MTTKILHFNDTIRRDINGYGGIEDLKVTALKGYQDGNYNSVARVLTSGNTDEVLRNSYSLTNSIDTFWGDNADVSCYNPKCRSTSVGDLILIGIEVHIVGPYGFDYLCEVK